VTRRLRRAPLGILLGLAVLLGSFAAMPPASEGLRPAALVSAPAVSAPSAPASRASLLPLAGIRIALDPGHQLGNHNFPTQINRPVPAGGFSKPCNTTGTATNGGFPEATVVFRITKLVKARLEALGARVFLTRTHNSQSLWGPCVDARGKFGAKVGARLTVSLHADGAASSAHGFHVIAPTSRSPWTTDIARPSLRLAKALRGGFDARGIPRSSYIGGGTALSIRSDLATLNLSDVPVAMIEVGNMRNAADAHRMTTRSGRARYAHAVVRGIRSYLHR
jgi:N-acetylmuramoyl-L-alanine amidase